MSFSFGQTAGASQSTAKPRLEGNNIYDVVFDGCEVEDIQGVKDPSQLYKVLKLKFSNEDGTYEHAIFEPKQADFERTISEVMVKGVKQNIPQPSGVESMMLLFKHAIDAINPAIAEAIDKGEKNLGAKDWNDLRKLVAKIQASMVVPFMYKMAHTGALPKFMQKKLNKTDGAKKELYNGFLNMFGIGKGGSPWITKQSIYNQFYSDLVTKVQHGIDVPGTTIHVFYATKMGRKYEKRYWTYFKNPDIRRHNMQHEELFCCHSAEWVEEVRKAVEGDKQ